MILCLGILLKKPVITSKLMCVYKYRYTICYNSVKSCKVDNGINFNDISKNIIFLLKNGVKNFQKNGWN